MMVADVSSAVMAVSGRRSEDGDARGKRELITRDLLGLGGCAVLRSPNLHDLLSARPAGKGMQDLNQIPEDSAALDLKLVSFTPVPAACSPMRACEYQSVCTLEKVKTALARAERESRGKLQHHQQQARSDTSFHSPSPSTASSSTLKRRANGEETSAGSESSLEAEAAGEGKPMAMVAAGCPGCLLYVLIERGNPRCPRCDSHVPLPDFRKKPRIDLNSARAQPPQESSSK